MTEPRNRYAIVRADRPPSEWWDGYYEGPECAQSMAEYFTKTLGVRCFVMLAAFPDLPDSGWHVNLRAKEEGCVMTQSFPVFKCRSHVWRGKDDEQMGSWFFYCPFCKREHVHSIGKGEVRRAHCDPGSPLLETGYVLEYDEDDVDPETRTKIGA